MKKLFCTIFSFIMMMSLVLPASAASDAKADDAEYFAIVNELNSKYDAQITLHNVPENMSVEKFREVMTSMAISSASIKAEIKNIKENGLLYNPAAALASSSTKTVNIGRDADWYVKLVCKNVLIGENDIGDTIFLSALSNNIYAREAHGLLQYISYDMSEQHAIIYDRGLTLELSAVGHLVVRSEGTMAKEFEMNNYATSVQCTPSDTVWM